MTYVDYILHLLKQKVSNIRKFHALHMWNYNMHMHLSNGVSFSSEIINCTYTYRWGNVVQGIETENKYLVKRETEVSELYFFP